MKRSLTHAARVLAAALSILAGALAAPGMAGAVESVKIGTVIWIGYGPYYVADALDLYKKSGLKVALQVFNGAPGTEVQPGTPTCSRIKQDSFSMPTFQAPSSNGCSTTSTGRENARNAESSHSERSIPG